MTVAEPPQVYYKSVGDDGKTFGRKKEITDIKYQGNALDVIHLMRHRFGPTAHISQVGYETTLRSYRP